MPNVVKARSMDTSLKNGRKHHPASVLQKKQTLFVVKYLRENQKMSFGRIGMELGFSRQRAHKLYKKALKEFPNNKHPFAWSDMKEDLK